jgi:hypothetical protein
MSQLSASNSGYQPPALMVFNHSRIALNMAPRQHFSQPKLALLTLPRGGAASSRAKSRDLSFLSHSILRLRRLSAAFQR